MRLPFEQRTLANGLAVIVHEDHQAPLVAVSVWYHVGSKHEVPGRTGLAHLFEHLMFAGSEHQPDGYFPPLQEAGASLNGSTSTDRTNYWEIVPRDAMRLALWMEADRMGWLLPALTDARFLTERDVVLNERRQNYENRPYGLAAFALMQAIYPPGHPYHWPTIGFPRDLMAASVDDCRAFFTRYYHPGNASLVIAGDVDPGAAFSAVEELFGDIPAGEHVPRLDVAPVEASGARLLLEDRVELPRLYLAWPSPPLFAAGDAELDLAADLLANGRTSRLYQRLVHETRIATELAAAQASRESGSTFQIIASAAPGHTLAEIASIIREEIARFIEVGPSAADLDRGRVQAEAAFMRRLQTLGGSGGKADQLNAYHTYLGAPDSFGTDLDRYLRATGGGLVDAVGRWLDPDRAVALCVVPRGQTAAALDGAVVPDGVI